jgi:hypothetical protein
VSSIQGLGRAIVYMTTNDSPAVLRAEAGIITGYGDHIYDGVL